MGLMQHFANCPDAQGGHPPSDSESPPLQGRESSETDLHLDTQSLQDDDPPPFLDSMVEDPLDTAPIVPAVKAASDISAAACRHASREHFFRNQTGVGLPNVSPADLDPKEVCVLLQAAKLASSLPRNENGKFARCTKSVQEVIRKQTLEEIEANAKCQRV